MAFLTMKEISALGLAEVGHDVSISGRASFYGAERIRIGNHVRIDDFCILSAGEGGISIGSYVHIAAYSSLIGAGTIAISDFANLSSRVSIYSSSDDYSGETMTNPTIPDEFKTLDSRPVTIGRHVIIGCGSVVLPGVVIGEGAGIGALSLVRRDCAAFSIYAGVPAKKTGDRKQGMVDLEKKFLREGR